MATGATGQLGLALPVQGELSGTWGDTVNNGITQYTNIAIAGTLTLTNDGAVTLQNTTGDASANNIVSTLTGAGTVTAQFAIVKVTGTLTTAKIITGPSYSKTYLVVNAATGSTVSFIRAGQTPAISIAVGESALVYFNGTDYVKVAGTTSGAAAGSNTQVQFNSSGVLAGSANMTFNGTTLTVNDLTDSSLTATRVTYAGTAGNLVDSANLTFDGTNLTVGGSATATRFIPSGSTVATNGMYLPAANSLGFSTNSTEAMRIRSDGAVGIGGAGSNSFTLNINRIPTATTSWSAYSDPTISATVTTYNGFESRPSTIASAFTVGSLQHYVARQGTIGASSAVTNQFGYAAHSSLTGATNNYGFYGDIASGTNRYNLYMAGTADNYLAGALGIGATALTGRNVVITKNLTGSVNSVSLQSNFTIQSDVTSSAYVYNSVPATAAASFTLTTLVGYRSAQGTIGAGSAVTQQIGFLAESTLSGATSNYGFYGNLASGTGRYNLFMNGTADNYLNGFLGIGATSSAGYLNLIAAKNLTGGGGTNAFSISQFGQVQSDVTGAVQGFRNVATTAAAAFTLSSYTHYLATQGSIGAGSAITTQIGFAADSAMTGATTNIGFYGDIASGSGRYNFYANGTAQNYFAGNVGIATTSPGSALDVKGTLRLSGSSSGYVGFAPAAAAGSTTYTLPSTDGSSGQLLSTNGSGTLSWATGGGGGGSAATPTVEGLVYGKMTTGNPITAIGYNAGLSNSTGTFNTAMGFEANKANTNGYSITAVGARAAWVINGGNNFTAVGTDSGRTSSTAISCSFFGANSGFSNTTGSYNTAIGDSAGNSNQAGTYNTFVGYQAGYSNNVAGVGANCFIGQATGYASTGAKNTFVGGDAAGYSMTTGASNTILGNFRGNGDGLDMRTLSNYAVISDGDQNRLLTTANGYSLALDGGAVPQAGTGITFPATQSASSNANTLDDYDEYTAASSACTLALTVSVVWKLTKVGNVVTLMLPPTFGTCAAAQSAWQYGVLLPSKYRPANTITSPVGLKDNGSVVTGTMGMIYINTAGEIRVYKSFNGTDTFTNGTTIGIAQDSGTSISWII
jgi:hypothetical protein